MRSVSLLAGLLVMLLVATPAFADPKWDHGGGPPGQRGRGDSDDGDRPPGGGPGNSPIAHWCQGHFGDPDAEHRFANHGQCVSFFVHQRQQEQADTDDFDDGSGLPRTDTGDLQITDVKIRHDGTFRLRGVGAEDLVVVSIGGRSGLVVGFGETSPGSDGDWTVEGHWACLDTDSSHDARFRAHDSDEVDSQAESFPCDDLHT